MTGVVDRRVSEKKDSFLAKKVKPVSDAKPSNPLMKEPPAARAASGVIKEEREWIEQAQRGDQQAFGRLVARYQDQAYGLALRILRSPPDAEEVAQDSFVRAWGALSRFRGDARFSTWLHRIVSRRALDRVAQLKSRRARETELEDLDRLAEVSAQPASEERALREQFTTRLLGRLNETQRTVVSLFYLEDQSIQQVAEALGMPEGSIKTHLFRSRKILREAYQAEEEAAS